MPDAYADIHHYEGINAAIVDDDGDPLSGFYFQLMQGSDEPLTPLTGPYGSKPECERAAMQEWSSL